MLNYGKLSLCFTLVVCIKVDVDPSCDFKIETYFKMQFDLHCYQQKHGIYMTVSYVLQKAKRLAQIIMEKLHTASQSLSKIFMGT